MIRTSTAIQILPEVALSPDHELIQAAIVQKPTYTCHLSKLENYVSGSQEKINFSPQAYNSLYCLLPLAHNNLNCIWQFKLFPFSCTAARVFLWPASVWKNSFHNNFYDSCDYKTSTRIFR